MRYTDLVARHGFIMATSVAMFVHSTWSFNTVFAGQQPHVVASPASWLAYLLWVTPGALIAAAIDIGQIQTSARLMTARTAVRRASLGFTFVTLALAGYYLQWFHLIHHMPALEFGAGLSAATAESIRWMRDAAIWIIPALLPLSTILYTISEAGAEELGERGERMAPVKQATTHFLSSNGHSQRGLDHERERENA